MLHWLTQMYGLALHAAFILTRIQGHHGAVEMVMAFRRICVPDSPVLKLLLQGPERAHTEGP